VDLERQDVKVLRRIAVKEALINELLAGRVSLLETAAQFRAMNAGRRDYALVMETSYPGVPDDERICRNVIGYAETCLEDAGDGRLKVRKLYDELAALKARGKLVIPGPALSVTASDDAEFE